MKSLSLLYRALFALFVLLAVALVAAAPQVGLWKGNLKIPGRDLAIEVSLARSAAGVWSGAIDIPAQGLRGFVLANVQVGEFAVGFAMNGIPGTPTFTGLYEAAENRISGDFTQGEQRLKFELVFDGDERNRWYLKYLNRRSGRRRFVRMLISSYDM